MSMTNQKNSISSAHAEADNVIPQNAVEKDAVTREIESWKVLAQNKHLEDYYIKHNFLVPLQPGEGRSKIAQKMAKALEELELVDFASAIPFIEMKLGDETGQAKLLFENLREAAVITNTFRGVVAVDISAFSDKLYDPEFEEFLNLAQNNNSNIVFILFVNRMPEEKLQEVLDILQIIGNTKLINPDETTTKELLKFALKTFAETGARIDDVAANELEQIIFTLKEKNSAFTYFKQIKKLADDIVYFLGTDETSDFYNTGVISRSDICFYKEHELKKHLVTKRERRVGF